MSYFNIFNNKKSSNYPTVKYQEKILSSDKSAKTNQKINVSHKSVEFLNFIGLFLGSIKNQFYFPTIFTGSGADDSRALNTTNYLRSFIRDVTKDPSPSPSIDFSQFDTHILNCKAHDDQIFDQILSTITDAEIVNTILDATTDPEYKKDLLFFNTIYSIFNPE